MGATKVFIRTRNDDRRFERTRSQHGSRNAPPRSLIIFLRILLRASGQESSPPDCNWAYERQCVLGDVRAWTRAFRSCTVCFASPNARVVQKRVGDRKGTGKLEKRGLLWLRCTDAPRCGARTRSVERRERNERRRKGRNGMIGRRKGSVGNGRAAK